ncbi:LolA family protein [Micromonospora sp. LOL_023]|uniref:LolA family protein n=1 Tax=Micromonospora sp. LOL_023 TaxID=3345418 RepID=UPI003A866942
MSVFTSRPAMRWLVPTAAAAVLIGGGAAIGALAASADPVLPPRSAEQLLVDLQTAEVDGMSGTVVHRAELGLPTALTLAGKVGAGEGLGSLIDGTQTLRVWYAGPDQARLALVRTLGETDVIRNGRDVWVWSSQQQEATHITLPEHDDTGAELTPEAYVTPQAAADQALAAIDDSTEVSVGRSAEIAGRTAYELILTPRAEESLVGEIRIAIDSVEYVPLRFAVYPAGGDRAAVETSFTQVSFERPDAEQFVFNPPPGTTVTEAGEDGGPDGIGQRPDDAQQDADPEATAMEEFAKSWADSDDAVRTVGSGWASVLVVTPPAEAADSAPEADAGDSPAAAEALQLLGNLPEVSGTWGSGRLLSSTLLTVLVTDDGRIFAGAVTPERLYEVADETR